MRPISKAMGMTAALALVLAVLAGRTWAEDAKTPPSPKAVLKALAEAGTPGPEHRKLEPFVGDWALTVKLWTDPSQPPAEATGTVVRQWVMGGRFVQETVQGQFEGKAFEGLGLLGYDSARKKFTSVKACGLCGSIFHGLSSCDASGTKFTCATEECCPLTGEKVQGRDEVVIESNDRIVTTVYKLVNGKEVKAMEIVSTRKK
jgi:Protein of unknown function (DUF1579)